MIQERFISIPDTDSEQIARTIAQQLGFPGGTRFYRATHTPPWQQDAVGIFHPDTIKSSFDIEVRRMFLDKGFGLIQQNGRFDLSRWQPTDNYIIGTSERAKGFCAVELKDMLQQKGDMEEKALANRLRKFITNVRWALTKASVNFP